MNQQGFNEHFRQMMGGAENSFHPLVWVNGEPEFGHEIYIGGFSVVNAKGARVVIGDFCDIASFVAINVADSHKRCIGLSNEIERRDIIIESHVFIGSHSVVQGGARVGHHTVVGAGTIVTRGYIPPYSLVVGNPMTIKAGYYENE